MNKSPLRPTMALGTPVALASSPFTRRHGTDMVFMRVGNDHSGQLVPSVGDKGGVM